MKLSTARTAPTVVLALLIAACACRPALAAPAPADASDAIFDGVMERVWDSVDLHWHVGEYSHIVNLYRCVAAAQPYRLEAYSNAAWLLWSMDRDSEAVATLELGIKENPGTYYMYDELANYYRIRKKDYAKALPFFEKAATFKDVRAASLHGLALAYEKTGQPAKALPVWKRAAAFPGDAVARARVQRLEKQLGAGASRR